MITETQVFILCTAGLMLTETVLIISVLKLNKNIEKLNRQSGEMFAGLVTKIKGLVDLFIAVQTVKLKKEEKQ